MQKIETIKEIDAYYDIKEECLYLTTYAEGCKISDTRLESISLDKVNELLETLQSVGVKTYLKTSELNVKEVWN